ncbi:HNH endonuclease [Pseudomonas cremoricolorata]|uniref:HNH endonuclease n=1 Tax=Pseudomonas cremoricolorata TaxID=157783 RepID=UPI00048BCAA0|nr:HNH endonuclease [Pseudomonas cremoricolorata]
MPVVIVEMDSSQWEDQTGLVYHFPKRYLKHLPEGAEAIYYKGRMKDKKFAASRLSRAPHYFGTARIGEVRPDPHDPKGSFFAHIENFAPFAEPVPTKIEGEYLETVPSNLASNYWRISVRLISQTDYDAILSQAQFRPVQPNELIQLDQEDPIDFVSANEGSQTTYFGTRYERRKDLRLKAIEIHGLDCKACGFDFEQAYGEHAKGFIHVHHVVPISKFGGEKPVNPATDLVTLCANCHAMVHRKRDSTLSIDELKAMLRGRWVFQL